MTSVCTQVTEQEDLSRDVLKSDTAEIFYLKQYHSAHLTSHPLLFPGDREAQDLSRHVIKPDTAETGTFITKPRRAS